MKYTVYFLCLLIALSTIISCSNQSSNPNSSEIIEKKDTLAQRADTVVQEPEPEVVKDIEPMQSPENLDELLDNTENIDILPYELDSAMVSILKTSEWRESSNLNTDIVRYLSSCMQDNDLTIEVDHYINTFVMIDSLRSNDLYEDYISNIYIGMTVYAEANVVDKLILSDSTFLLLWMVYTATYEACPHYSGTQIFGTLFYKNRANATLLLGESSGGGDPPYWSTNLTTSMITDSTIQVYQHVQSGGEMDENDNEIVERNLNTYEFVIKGADITERIQ